MRRLPQPARPCLSPCSTRPAIPGSTLTFTPLISPAMATTRPAGWRSTPKGTCSSPAPRLRPGTPPPTMPFQRPSCPCRFNPRRARFDHPVLRTKLNTNAHQHGRYRVFDLLWRRLTTGWRDCRRRRHRSGHDRQHVFQRHDEFLQQRFGCLRQQRSVGRLSHPQRVSAVPRYASADRPEIQTRVQLRLRRFPTDAFVAKINPLGPTGLQLLFSTYLGGAGTDSGPADCDRLRRRQYLPHWRDQLELTFVLPTGISPFQLCLDTPLTRHPPATCPVDYPQPRRPSMPMWRA